MNGSEKIDGDGGQAVKTRSLTWSRKDQGLKNNITHVELWVDTARARFASNRCIYFPESPTSRPRLTPTSS